MVRDIMSGYGFQEVLNYILTGREDQTVMMGLDGSDLDLVELANPMTSEHAVARRWILPCLLNFLSLNTHVDYPQKIFECGDVIAKDEAEETQTRVELRLAGAICDYKVSYETIQSIVYGVLHYLGVEGWSVKVKDHKSFLKGRTAAITAEGGEVAVMGEVHPQILTNFRIPNPVVAFEINLTPTLHKKLTHPTSAD